MKTKDVTFFKVQKRTQNELKFEWKMHESNSKNGLSGAARVQAGGLCPEMRKARKRSGAGSPEERENNTKIAGTKPGSH